MTAITSDRPKLKDPLGLAARIFIRNKSMKQKAERSFAEFVRQAWHIVEPGTPFIDNWHIDAIADHLEATLPQDGKPGMIRNLVITIPPRMMKTIIISVLWPAWVWIHYPHLRFVYASYAEGLSNEHSIQTRMVVESDWYQKRWGHIVQLAPGENNKMAFSTTKRGYRRATSVGGKTTGMGGDVLVVDDPHNVQRAESDAVRGASVHWWTKAMSTRLNNPKTGVRIIIQQRVHQEDVAGVAIASGDYVHLNLPMEYEPTDYVSPIGWRDPRTEPGELLWPNRFGMPEVEKLKRELGSYQYAAQFQQRPVPAGGGIVKRWWIRYWQYPGQDLHRVVEQDSEGREYAHPLIELPTYLPNQLQSWDLSFQKTDDGSYVVGLQGAVSDALLFLLDRFKDHTDFPGTIRAFVSMGQRWPETSVKLVENKANGPALMSTLQSKVPGIVSVHPEGSKEARMHAAAPFIEGGGLVLPHPDIAPWVNDYVDQITTFPMAKHDDDADATSQLIQRITADIDDGMDDVVEQFLQNMGVT